MAGEKVRIVGWLFKWGILAAILVYILALLGPYLRSTLVRDAAVSAWIHTATSPIYGQAGARLPTPGTVIGADGILARVTNEQADRSPLDRAEAEARRADAQVLAARRLVEQLEEQRADIVSNYDRYAQVFKRDLELDREGTISRLEQVDAELALLRTLAERAERLSNRGFVAKSDRDEATMRVAGLEGLRAELRAQLGRIRLRQEAAEDRVYLMDDGAEPVWAGDDREAVDRALWHARADLASAEALLESAWADSHAADAAYRQIREGVSRVPPGSMIWSVRVGEGATLEIGDPIADWIDCNELLVDVPMADAEIALLERGMTADVVLEGESQVREGQVLLTRGSGSLVGREDLAAISQARRGSGQVILLLAPDPRDEERCPVGQAAFVDFHDVGLFDVIAARLRLR